MSNISFAPIGLLDMFNAGGAVEEFSAETVSDESLVGGDRAPVANIIVKVRGCGRFGAYLSMRPMKCRLDSSEVEFSHDAATGLLTLEMPVPEKEMYRWTVEILV